MLQQALSVAGCPGRVPEHSKPRVHRTTHLPASQSQAKRGRAAGRPAMTDHLIRATRIQTGSGRTGKGSLAPPVRHWPGQCPASTATQYPKCKLKSLLTRPDVAMDWTVLGRIWPSVPSHATGQGFGICSLVRPQIRLNFPFHPSSGDKYYNEITNKLEGDLNIRSIYGPFKKIIFLTLLWQHVRGNTWQHEFFFF